MLYWNVFDRGPTRYMRYKQDFECCTGNTQKRLRPVVLNESVIATWEYFDPSAGEEVLGLKRVLKAMSFQMQNDRKNNNNVQWHIIVKRTIKRSLVLFLTTVSYIYYCNTHTSSTHYYHRIIYTSHRSSTTRLCCPRKVPTLQGG